MSEFTQRADVTIPHKNQHPAWSWPFAIALSVALDLISTPGLAQTLTLEHHSTTDIPEEIIDIPEEVLESEIILEGRSPIDGQLLTPAEYAQLEDDLNLSRGEVPGRIAPKIQRAVVLLKLRKIITTLFPFF